MLRSLLALGLGSGFAVFFALPQSQVSGRTDDRAEPGTLSVDEIAVMLKAPGALEPFVPEAPLGITANLADFIPADNPMTPAKVELGRQLYFDKRLSRDGTISCATCHDPVKGWGDAGPVSTGIAGQMGARSAPIVPNRILGKTQFWDGRAASLEEQAVGPVGNPIEMGFTIEEAAERLNSIPGYAMEFKAVFGSPASPDLIAKAIATFERSILSGANKNDYFELAMPYFDWDPADEEDEAERAKGERILFLEETHRMTLAAERGRGLFFGKAKCSACHVGQDLTDESFHNIGIGMDAEEPDLGRIVVTEKEEDRGAFKTPSLRNIAQSAPYMHDGSLATLYDVVVHYDQGGLANPGLSEKIFPLELTEQERQDLVAFMEDALTGDVNEVEVPRLP